MAYIGKTNWVNNEIVEAVDMNRIEQGITNLDALKVDKTYVDNKVKTDVPAGAKFTDTVYTHPTTAGNKHIPTGGASGQVLKYSASGTVTWQADSDTITTINGKTGAITKADITALGIPAQDTVIDISGKADITYVNSKVKTDVPEGAKFTDTTYSEITTAEIDTGTASTLRTITGRRVKYILDSLSTEYAASSHSHSGSDIISGTIPFAQLPTGTSSSQVAIGNHTHSAYAASSHTHSAYAASSHTHAIANVTNLQTTLNGKAPSVLYGSTVPSSLLPGQIFVKI